MHSVPNSNQNNVGTCAKMILQLGDVVHIKKHPDDCVWTKSMDKYEGQTSTIKRFYREYEGTELYYITADNVFVWDVRSLLRIFNSSQVCISCNKNSPHALPNVGTDGYVCIVCKTNKMLDEI